MAGPEEQRARWLVTAQDLGTARDVRAAAGSRGSRSSEFRADVEGVRAIAVLAVLLFHAHVPFVRGGFVGVDVFFVVSGYVITGVLLREIVRDGRISFLRFYARRAKRLLPAGTLVLVLTALATWLLLPVTRWPAVGTDVAAAGLFVVNWVLALRATDYLGSAEAPSPVQQYWSLSVEEQFYLVWPALLSVAVVLAVRRRVGTRRMLLGAMAVVLVPSLAYCTWATSHSPSSAFFSSLTRLWEMALGGVIALITAELTRLSPRVRAWAGWLGAALIGGSLVLIDPTTPFPGTAALAPTLGTAALLIAGVGSRPGVVTRGLATRPLVWIGGLSYSLYLWHWPAVSLTEAMWPEVSWPLLVGVTLAACVPAWLSFRLLENPVRHAALFERSRASAIAMGGALVAVAVASGLLLASAAGVGRSVDGTSVTADERGAEVLRDPQWVAGHPQAIDSFTPLLPSPVDAADDNPAPDSPDCRLWEHGATVWDCRLVDPTASYQVALVGDSKLSTWVPALTQLAQKHGWGLRVLMKRQCPLTGSQVTATPDGSLYVACEEWKQKVWSLLESDPPDLMLLTATNHFAALDQGGTRVGGEARAVEVRRGFRATGERAEALGITPVFLADTPLMLAERRPADAPDCVAANLDHLSACATPRDLAVDQRDPVDRILAADTGYQWRTVDLTDAFCLPTTCPAVVGHVIVYRDAHHITATYARTLTPWVEEALAALRS